MKQSTLTNASKFLSWALRHSPSEVGGLQVDKEGWVELDTLLDWAQTRGPIKVEQENGSFVHQKLTCQMVKSVLAMSGKQRFTLDGTRIRAEQGHSTKTVAIQYRPTTPPPRLFHGTATRFLDSILKTGLDKRERSHVHLSGHLKTAVEVGKRHGIVVVLSVDAAAMVEHGFTFYLTDNNVWLTDTVPPEFLTVLHE